MSDRTEPPNEDMYAYIVSCIRAEASDCDETANDMRNSPETRNTFLSMGIMLAALAEKIERKSNKNL